MRKRWVGLAAVLGCLVSVHAGPAWALSEETTMLLELLQAKGVITQKEAAEFSQTLENKLAVAAEDGHHHSVQSLTDRVERLEKKGGEGEGEPARRVKLSGLVEASLTAARSEGASGARRNTSDLTLDTALLNVDAAVNQYVNGHLALLYEEDPADPGTNNIGLDEAIIRVNGGVECPASAYGTFGRMYVPFGSFESHFVTDPLTLTLGETNDTAVVAGYMNETVDLSAGVFKGKVKEAGRGAHINAAVASATLSLPKGEGDLLAMNGGVSFLSNLATSDSLEAEVTSPEAAIADPVGGVSTFLSLAYDERFFLEAEYLGAVSDFADGDLNFVDPDNRRPRAWNLEAAARVLERLELALRYGGSAEAGTFLAEDEYGAALLYRLFDNTSLTIEYLFQEYLDRSDNSQATMQLAVEL